MQQCLLFARFSESKDDNLYAHPMDFFPILNSDTFEVMHIDFASHRTMKGGELSAETTAPPTLEANSFEAAGRERIMPPVEQFEYLPEFLEKQEGFKGMRTDLKPLHVVQPEGVSFKMTGNVIEWQKWKMHIGESSCPSGVVHGLR